MDKTQDSSTPEAEASQARTQPRPLTPAASRALAEAEARRQAQHNKAQQAREIGGRNGPDPVRYGDWEKNGIASDF